MGDKLSHRQARDWHIQRHTHRHTDRQTQVKTLSEGQNWPRVTTIWNAMKWTSLSVNRCHFPDMQCPNDSHVIVCTSTIWVRSRNCGCLVTWFCYQLIAKPGNKTAAVSWPIPYGADTFYASQGYPGYLQEPYWNSKGTPKNIQGNLTALTFPQNASLWIPYMKLQSTRASIH